MDTVTPGLIEIWPPKGRERVALGLGALQRDGRYWLDPARQDDNAQKLKKMFGTEAARRIRKAALAQAAPANAAAAPVEPAATAPSDETPPTVLDVVTRSGARWVWTEAAAQIGAEPGASFVPLQAFFNLKKRSLDIRVDVDGVERTYTIQGDDTDLNSSLDRKVAELIRRAPEHAIDQVEAVTSAAAAEPASEPEATPSEALLDRLIAISGGATGTAVEWIGENLDRPQTAARTGMRAVITSASLAPGAHGSQVLKLVLDYRGFAEHNAKHRDAQNVPNAFETVDMTVTVAEGEGLAAVATRLGRTFREVPMPVREVAPDHKSAAELRKTDERLQIAEAANAEVVRTGEMPPAPIPPVNPSPVASRVYFWTAREDESAYCFKKLLSVAAAAGVPLLVDRDKRSDHWGLRYIEATQAEVAALPDEMKAFLTEAARQAHIESKTRAKISKQIIADAAATSAIEVTTKREAAPRKETARTSAPKKAAPAPAASAAAPNAKPAAGVASEAPAPTAEPEARPAKEPEVREEPAREPRPLRPLAVPHPKHDHEGWLRARDALYNIDTAKLVELMDLTWKMHRDLEIQEDMAATMGEELPRAQARQLATWSHGLKLGEKVLEKKGVAWVNPGKRQELAQKEQHTATAERGVEQAPAATPDSTAAAHKPNGAGRPGRSVHLQLEG